MGLLDTIRDSVLNWAVKSTGMPIMSTTGNRFAAPDRRAFEQQANAYLNQVVLACIATRAQTLNEPPLTAVDPITKEIIPQHPLTRLFRRPNKDMSQSMFWQYVSTYVDIGGNAYIHKVRNVYGQVIELRPYHSGHIVPISESGQWVDYYQYQYDNVSKEIDPRDIIHIRSYYIDPLNPILGISPIRAAGINIDTYNELMQTLYSYLRNNGVPSGVLSVQQTINQQQAESLKEQFQTNTTGRNRGKPIVLPSGMSYTQMGLDVSKMEAGTQFAQYETAICGIYRVHPSVAMTMAGLQSSTYSNMQTAFQEYTLLTRVPTWNTWEEQVELSFANEYPEVDVEFDTSNIGALQSDPDAVIYPVVATFNANLVTVNEARQRLGYPPATEGGDNYAYNLVAPAPAFGALSAKQSVLALNGKDAARKQTATELVQDVKWQPVEYPTEGQIDQSTDLKAEAFWKSMDDTIVTFSKSLQTDTSKLIEGIGKVLINNATKSGAQYDTKQNDPKMQLLIDQYMKATGAWRKNLAKQIMKLAVTEVNADFTSVESELDKIVADLNKDMAANITDSVGTIQQEVQDTVASMSGSSAEDIEKKLLEKFDTLKQSRAQAIAQTQARASSTKIATSTWSALNEDELDKQNEIVKVWTTRRDGRVRESHRALDGKWVEMGAKFNGTLQGPGIGTEAGEVVRCRCVLRPVRRKNIDRQAR
jgi:HK97 family phage portal protein